MSSFAAVSVFTAEKVFEEDAQEKGSLAEVAESFVSRVPGGEFRRIARQHSVCPVSEGIAAEIVITGRPFELARAFYE